MPEPDVAVVRGAVNDGFERHPEGPDLALVVEVSVTSQALDRAKAAVYARAGVPEYWQIDVPARRLVACTEPQGGEYRSTRLYTERDEIRVGSTSLSVAELLPPRG